MVMPRCFACDTVSMYVVLMTFNDKLVATKAWSNELCKYHGISLLLYTNLTQ